MISGGLSTGIDFPPKMLSLSLGSSVIGGSLSDRHPLLCWRSPPPHSQVIMTDEGVVREGARAPVTQERPSLETPPSPMAGQLPTLGRRGSTFPSYPHPLDHAYICKMFVHIRISLPSSAKFLRSQAMEILTNRLGKKSQTVPTQSR